MRSLTRLYSVSLECTADSMTVTLNTEEPFTGRLYSQVQVLHRNLLNSAMH